MSTSPGRNNGDGSVASPCGVLNVNKPTGVTSRAVVDRVARLLLRVKVGHAGTLDPLASGVLILCIGAATRLIEYVQRMPKRYTTVIRLGARSDTNDADGTVVEAAGALAPGIDAVRDAVAIQVGTILQKPPEYSALKVEGRRAYDLARAGKVVDLAPRPVTIHAIDVKAYEWPRLTLEVRCEGGTYIRSIARDVGETLGCGGLVEVLVRPSIGHFQILDAIDLETLDAESLPGLLLPAAEAVSELSSVRLTAEQVADVARGRPVTPVGAERFDGEIALFEPDGTLAAVGEVDPISGHVMPRRVLVRS